MYAADCYSSECHFRIAAVELEYLKRGACVMAAAGSQRLLFIDFVQVS